jgi:hypothetical protein
MWIEIQDTDGNPALLNFDTVKSIKAFNPTKTTVTFDQGNMSVQVNNTYESLSGQLRNDQVPYDYSINDVGLLSETPKDELPEPMKEPKGKVGSGVDVDAVKAKLTAPKKGGTTSSALE